VDLDGPAGRLEALLNEGAPDAPYAALVCHPHPLGGGTMHNKVVYHAMKTLNAPEWGLCWPVLRFNFRGIGLSEGNHDGAAESGDVLAAIDWLVNAYNRPVVVAGFSFGAAMAVNACCGLQRDGNASSTKQDAMEFRGLPLIGQKRRMNGAQFDLERAGEAGGRLCGDDSNNRASVRALALIGLPTCAEGRDYSYPSLSSCTIPKLFLSGDRDQYAPAAQREQVAASAAEPKSSVAISGADHFFHDQLEQMQQALAGWLKEQLP
jgi:alpha/beta superfamily hydrolase